MQRNHAPLQNQEINFPSLETIFLKKFMVPLKAKATNKLDFFTKSKGIGLSVEEI